MRARACVATALLCLASVGGALSCSPSSATGDESATEPLPPPLPVKDRALLLDRLGREHRFLVGHGNDLPGAEKGFDFTQAGIYTLPTKPDLHYVYLTGIKDEVGVQGTGWPDYNPDGSFVTMIATIDAERGVLPMFTLYQAAARGERNFEALRDADFMTKYWAGVRLLFTRLAAFGKPAMVHFEPDFWGYAQQQARGSDPKTVPVRVGSIAPECAGVPEDVLGMARCLLKFARTASNVAVGFHASGFGALGKPLKVAAFLTEIGAGDADFLVLETLDRDAGCFEAGSDPQCTRVDGPVYWDDTNTQSPSFRDHLDWVRTLHDRLGLPVVWWQMPLGVPSDAPGGSPGHYRDNRVKYFFEHMDEFEAVGGVAAAFGVGAPNQTDISSDGGQFARAVQTYYAAPLAIRRP